MNNSKPRWAITCPDWIVQKLVKDFGFYKGLEIPVDVINVATAGLIYLSQPVMVKVLEIADIEVNESWSWAGADVLWKVSLSESSEFLVRQELFKSHNLELHKDEDLDPFIPGFIYYVSLEHKTIEHYYRGWQRSAKS